MDEEFLPICVDDYPGDGRYDPDQQPDPVDPRSTSRNEMALAKYKLWEVGQELRIRFLDGTQALHERVMAHAHAWLEHANLEFNFGNHVDAEIRVTFQGNGYRSLVGTDALLRPDPDATMTLGGFTEDMDDELLQRVVLHEFGHALGCVHEHASPSIRIPWDKEKVYDYYWRNFKWDKAKVDWNVLKRYSKAEVDFTPHDSASIMQYPVRNEHTIGDFEIGWNTTLSDSDKMYIRKMYPYPEPPQ